MGTTTVINGRGIVTEPSPNASQLIVKTTSLFSGTVNLNTNNITNVNLINGIDITTLSPSGSFPSGTIIVTVGGATYTGEIVTLSAYPEGEPLDNYDENSRLIILGEPQQLRDIEKFGILTRRLEEFIEDARSNRQIDGVDSFASLAQKLLTQSVLTPERFKTFATSLIGGTASR